MIITDEILEAAQKAANVATSDCLRAALEAVAPKLIAAELRIWGDDIFEHVRSKDLRNRAQELDPK